MYEKTLPNLFNPKQGWEKLVTEPRKHLKLKRNLLTEKKIIVFSLNAKNTGNRIFEQKGPGRTIGKYFSNEEGHNNNTVKEDLAKAPLSWILFWFIQ